MPGCVQSGTGFPDGQAFGKCVPEFAWCFAESASHSGRSKWDTLSQRRSNGKLRPIIRSRNGMHFPNESKTGKCISQSPLKVGRRFPMRLKRKMHPGICAQSGMRFPVEGLGGNCIPELMFRMGQAFRMSPQPEAASQNPSSKRVAFSQLTPKRKPRPRISPQSGTRFPDGLPTGNCVPFQT